MSLSQRIAPLLALIVTMTHVPVLHGARALETSLYLRAEGDPIVLIYADEYAVQTIDSVSIRELSGRVHLVHGDVHVWCDKATQYTVANRVVLRGSVKVRQGTLTMSMPEGEYDGSSGIAVGRGGVVVTDKATRLRAPSGTYNSSTSLVDFEGGVYADDDSLHMTSDRTRYSRSSGESWAHGNVVVHNKRSPIVLGGDSAYNNPKIGYSRIEGNSVLEQVDSVLARSEERNVDSVRKKSVVMPSRERERRDKRKSNDLQPLRPQTQALQRTGASADTAVSRRKDSDTLTIAAQRMEAYRQGGREVYEATGNTEIVRRRMAARCGRCVYEKNNEQFVLTMKPCMWSDSLSLQADTVLMYFIENKLRSVEAAVSAFMSFADSGRSDRKQQVSAERIYVDVKTDSVRSVRAVQDAKSLYFMEDDNGPNGASRTFCDSLLLVFHGGQIDTILWRSGVAGEYVPENLVAGGVSQYYLPSFKDAGPRPRKASMALRLQRDIEIRSRESVFRGPDSSQNAK